MRSYQIGCIVYVGWITQTEAEINNEEAVTYSQHWPIQRAMPRAHTTNFLRFHGMFQEKLSKI